MVRGRYRVSLREHLGGGGEGGVYRHSIYFTYDNVTKSYLTDTHAFLV